jgi:hypothetical protein
MRTKFERFIEKHYKGLNFITIPNEAYNPGVILNEDDRIFSHLARIFPDDKKWKTRLVMANMPNEVVNGKRNLDIGVTLLGIVTLKGGFDAAYTVSFEFKDVSEMIFDFDNGGAYESDVRILIQKLKEKDPVTWGGILHKFVAMEVVIIKSATVSFTRNGKALGQVDLPLMENELSISGSYSWDSGGKMVINNDKNLPFGVLGFQVKRMM